MEESALVWRRAPWCGGERPGVEESALVLEEGALVWIKVPCCGGKRPGVQEGSPV